MSKFIKKEDIYQATGGGLKVIQAYYPDANERKPFKIRDEKTASSSLKKYGDIWYVTDFGSDAKGKDCIQIVKEEEGIEFHDALLYINDRFCNGSLNGETASTFNKPIVEEVENKSGKIILEFNKKISDKELSFIGKGVTQEIAERYNLKSLKFYITKGSSDKKPKKITATPDYPILCFDQGDWQKIYQPKGDKNFRFFHSGTRPKDYIFGLEQLKADVEKLKEEAKLKITKEGEGQDVDPDTLQDLISEEIRDSKPDVIIASGERDALNIAAAGYIVVWQNSETAKLPYEKYKELKELSKNLYNVPDLDDTGVREGYSLALQYTEIKTIWVPEYLRDITDWRGNKCKDATDFFNTKYNHERDLSDADLLKKRRKSFSKMKSVASSLVFWYKDKKKGYMLNNLAFYHFLHANGYYKITDKNNKHGYAYIKLNGKVVEKIDPDTKGSIKNHVKDFVNTYFKKKYAPEALRNMFFKTRQTDENSMSNLEMYNHLDFKTYDKDYQYMFFKDRAWKVTAEGIEEKNLKDIDKHVWETDIKTRCKHVRKTKKPIFDVTYSKEYQDYLKKKDKKEKDTFPEIDKYSIEINDKQFLFMRYLMNTSRLYWKKEAEGIELSEAERKEQRLHLINKIYSYGYLAHRSKSKSKAWAVFAIDGRESEYGKSYGGSGKSIFYESIEHVNSQFNIGGRDQRKLNNEFLFDGVDENTYNILIDDANQYLNFGSFYTYITGKFNVNPKNNKPFTLDFNESPKFAFTSNFAIRNIDPSTERRLMFTVFSDYYHKKDQDGYYKDTLDPRKEFGKDLFDDFTESEWNLFYNFVASCIQTYLKFEKIDPPMENVTKRNLRTDIGEDVLAWANDYFADPTKLNTEINKEEIFSYCMEALPAKSRGFMSIRKFKDKIRKFCMYRDWTFNPEEAQNDNQGRIMKQVDGKVTEHFYIQTSEDKPVNIDHNLEDEDELKVPEQDTLAF